MRHLNYGRKLSRNTAHRRSLLRNLVTSLILEERIETTVPKAKAARGIAEQMITLGKRGDLHARRLAAAYFLAAPAVKKLFEDVAKRYTARNGGYTRIVRTGWRKGDGADTAVFRSLRVFNNRLELPHLDAALEARGLAWVEPAGSDRVYNTVVAVGGDGRLIGAYRKIHLYDAFGQRESDRIKSGDGQTLTFELGGLGIGVMTCYEVRFPEMARRLSDLGADLILLPAAWVRGPLKEMHWDTLARARAIENTVYVAAAGQVSATYAGLSAIYDPMGVAVVSGGESEGVVAGEVTRERIDEVRLTNPSLSLRRPDVYAGWQLVRT